MTSLRLFNLVPEDYSMGIVDDYREAMPRQLQYDLVLQESKQLSDMTLQELLEGLEKYASLREDTDRILKMSSENNPRYNSRNLTTMVTTGRAPPKPCSFCDGNHYMDKCTEVTDPYQRYRIFQEKKLCTICTSNNHNFKKCSKRRPCWGKPGVFCNGSHHTSLHEFFTDPKYRRAGGPTYRQQPVNNGNNNASNRPPQNPPNPQ